MNFFPGKAPERYSTPKVKYFTLTQIVATTLMVHSSPPPTPALRILNTLLLTFHGISHICISSSSSLVQSVFPALNPSCSDFHISSLSPYVLLCFGEISAGNCESFTSCSHNGLWDYAKHSASAALPIDQHQQRPLEHTGKRWRTLNEDVTAISQARFTDTLHVCSSSSRIPLSPLLRNFFATVF